MLLLTALICALGVNTATAAEEKEAKSDLDFDLEGYFRARGYAFKDLFATPISGPASGRPGGTATYMQQRLRLQPTFSFEKRAKFTMMADVMDDVIWGDNASLSSTPLFASDPSATDAWPGCRERIDSHHLRRRRAYRAVASHVPCFNGGVVARESLLAISGRE